MFRAANSGDLPELLKLERATFAPHRQSTTRSLRLSVASPFQSAWVAEKNEGGSSRIVAAAILYPHKHRFRIYSIAVNPACRGEGVGQAFMTKIRELAETRGCREIALEADASDTRLVNWYTQQGFNVLKTLPDYYAPGEHAVRMTVRLVRATG